MTSPDSTVGKSRVVSVPSETAVRLRRLAAMRREPLEDTLVFLLPRIETLQVDRRGMNGGELKPIRIPEPIANGATDEDMATLCIAAAESLPRLVRHSDGPPSVALTFGADPDGTPWVRVPNGRILYNDATISTRERQLFELMRDRLPPDYDIERYHLAVMAQQRYLKYFAQADRFHFPPRARVAVDAGAFVGCKALAMLDAMHAEKVIAIELDGSNFALLKRTVKANGLQGRLIPVQAAISDREGTASRYRRGTGAMGHSIVAVEFGVAADDLGAIQTTTLARIFHDRGLDHIDYLNIQLNGAEPLAVRGLGEWLDRIDTVFAACPYRVDGVGGRDSIVSTLTERGFHIVDDGQQGRVIAHKKKP